MKAAKFGELKVDLDVSLWLDRRTKVLVDGIETEMPVSCFEDDVYFIKTKKVTKKLNAMIMDSGGFVNFAFVPPDAKVLAREAKAISNVLYPKRETIAA